MRSTTLFYAALALADGAFAVNLSSPTGLTKPRSFRFEKVRRNVDNIPKLRKRADTVTQHLDNMVCGLATTSPLNLSDILKDFLYYANITIGTPPQKFRLQYVVAFFCFTHDELTPIIITRVTVLTRVRPISGSKVQRLRCVGNRLTLASLLELSISAPLRHTRRLRLISAFLMSTGSTPKVTMARMFLPSQMARILKISSSELDSTPAQPRESWG